MSTIFVRFRDSISGNYPDGSGYGFHGGQVAQVERSKTVYDWLRSGVAEHVEHRRVPVPDGFVRVKFLESMAGDDFSYVVGQCVNLPEAQARVFLRGKNVVLAPEFEYFPARDYA